MTSTTKTGVICFEYLFKALVREGFHRTQRTFFYYDIKSKSVKSVSFPSVQEVLKQPVDSNLTCQFKIVSLTKPGIVWEDNLNSPNKITNSKFINRL